MNQRQLFLRDVLTVLFKRKLLIVLFAVVVFGVVFAGNYVWPPTYESEARVRLVEGREQLVADPTVTQSQASMTMLQMTVEDLHSEIALLYSDDVLSMVVDALHLDQRGAITGAIPEAVPTEGQAAPGNGFDGDAEERAADDAAAAQLRERFASLSGGAGPVHMALRTAKRSVNEMAYLLGLKVRPTPRQEAIEGLARAIDVEPVEKSYVMDIRCRYSDPVAAQVILDTVVRKFRAKHIEVFSQQKSRPFIEEQLVRVREELKGAQGKLEQFRNEHTLLAVDVEKKQLIEQYDRAKRLQLQLAKLDEVTQSLRAPAPGGPGVPANKDALMTTLSSETEHTVITELQLQLLDKLKRKYEIMQTKGPNHPDRVGIENEIEKALADLVQALDITRATTEKQITTLNDRLKQLNTIMAENEALEQQVEIKTDAVKYYCEKLEEATVADASTRFRISSIRTLSAPSLPVDPVSPRKLFNLLLAVIGGIIGGIALAFFLEYLDHGIKTPEDIDHYLHISPLASFFHSADERLDPREAQRLSAMIEAVNPDTPLQLIQVASSVGGEGGHRVARALAEVHAQDPERKTLLVDFVGDAFPDAPTARGLLDVVEGTASLADVVSSMGNLYLVGRGAQRECPTFLWRSKRMAGVLTDLRQRFDRVIFYVGPVLGSHDALNLAQLSDGVVVVIRSDSTRREVVLRALQMVAEAKGRVLGSVLTERKQVIPKAVYGRI